MYSFKNDYSEGAHPNILQGLVKSNMVQQIGYGNDSHSLDAKNILKNLISNQNSAIHFVSGGTQANHLISAAFLRPHEAVVCVKTGHIFVHEAGAVEATGHKVITVKGTNGKISVNDVENVLEEHALAPHMVKPKLVYISNSTEVGTIYTKKELADLSSFCKSKGLYLYMDGARLGHALMSEDNDISMTDLGVLLDAFYIGATKNGGLLGEAIVINNPVLQTDFDFIVKQNGALLAKGRILGIQFQELFADGLYFKLAKHANDMAMKLQKGVIDKGYSVWSTSSTNQIFPILPNAVIERLKNTYDFYTWGKVSAETSAIRLITSWATDEKQVDDFINSL